MNRLGSDSVLEIVLRSFGVDQAEVKIFGSGLINRTWKVYARSGNYILQRINEQVFLRPNDIAYNIRVIAEYFKKNDPDYFFVAPVNSASGEDMIHLVGEGWFRLVPFIENSVSFDVVETPGQAYEAAKQFGAFTRSLAKLNARQLKITIPDFHNLHLRYQQFLDAVTHGNRDRIRESHKIINELFKYNNIVEEFQKIIVNQDFKIRVTHHDTKISNVLFDKNNKALCVIDLDTVMPGYFFSDVGDMMRTYLSAASEEERDLDKVTVRDDFYKAIVTGYTDEMKDELTETEKKSFGFAGKFMIYMQALRFITDYLNNDVYYGKKYDGHNLVRAKNQLILLQELMNHA